MMKLAQALRALRPSVHATTRPRSAEWPKVRAEWLRDHSTCAACGTTKHVEVHHIQPFHLHPELELDPTNFITLCEGVIGGKHHLHVGHLGNWQMFNANVRADALAMLGGNPPPQG